METVRLYRVVVYEATVPTKGAALPEGTPISEIIEFVLDNPPENSNVFSLLKQYEKEEAICEASFERPVWDGKAVGGGTFERGE